MMSPTRLPILLMLFTFSSALAVIFSPALPLLSDTFAISASKTQSTISIFLIGYTVGLLLYGPLANRFGRKRVIYAGIAIAFFGSLVGLFATSFSMVCLARLIQALGSSVGLKVAFTMIGDLYTGRAATKAVATVTLSFGVMPGLFMAIGGYLTQHFGWQAIFLFSALYSAALGFGCILLPETAKHFDKDALRLKRIAQGYFKQFRHLPLMVYALMIGLTASIIYVYAAISPTIAIRRMGLSPAEYGLWNFFPYGGLIVGALLSRSLAEKLSSRWNILIGFLLMLSGTLSMYVCFADNWVTPWNLFVPMAVIYIGNNLLWANASAAGLSLAQDKSNASAVIQFSNLGLCTLSTFLIETVPPSYLLLLPSAFGVLLLGIFLLWLVQGRKKLIER